MQQPTLDRPPSRPGAPRRTGIRRAAAALAGAAAVALTAGCASRSVPADLGVTYGATVKDITANPRSYEGRMVTVSGEVNRIFGPRWFSIGGEGFGGGEELLVVGASALPALLDNMADSGMVMNDLVQVTGRVRVFEEDAIEKEINADLDGDFWRLYDAKPVVVMTDLDVTPRVDVVPVAAVPVPVPVAPITDELVIITAPDRMPLVGQSVALMGVEVRSVVGKSGFWVGPSDDRQLFVMLDSAAAGSATVRPGERVGVAGVIRALPADLASVRWAWGLTPSVESMLAGERIYLSASRVVPMGGTVAGHGDRRIPVRKDPR